MAFPDIPDSPLSADGIQNRYELSDGVIAFLDTTGTLRQRTGLRQILKALKQALQIVSGSLPILRKIFAENREVLSFLELLETVLEVGIFVIDGILTGVPEDVINTALDGVAEDLQQYLDGLGGAA